MWRSSGRGCMVIPFAPKDSILLTISMISGLLAPLAFRNVAILFTFTLNRVFIKVVFNNFVKKMELKNTIDNQIKESMLNKDKDRLTALRAIKSAILLEEKNGKEGSINEIQILMKLIKQRKDSLTLYKEQKRLDLAVIEESEINIIQEFLPDQINDNELDSELDIIIKSVGAESIKDMGKVMGIATKKLSGKVENSRIASRIKEKLS